MTQKIIKIGTSAGIVLPKPTMKKMGLKIGDRVEVDLEKDRNEIVVTSERPKISSADARVGRIALDILNRYRQDFENLADK